ncbi:MAG: hypothetical protein J0L51_06430 [Rhizobiales bacterium]|nr:hypothetical protein [Hyphomicrobiales bacterium]
MRRSALNLALVFSILAIPALAEGGGGGDGGGPSGVISPPPAGARTTGVPPRLPGIYGQHTKPLDWGATSRRPRYTVGTGGTILTVHSTRSNGAPDEIVLIDPASGATIAGKLISFEPRRGGSFIIEIEQRTGETPTRFFVGRTGNIETLTR